MYLKGNILIENVWIIFNNKIAVMNQTTIKLNKNNKTIQKKNSHEGRKYKKKNGTQLGYLY